MKTVYFNVRKDNFSEKFSMIPAQEAQPLKERIEKIDYMNEFSQRYYNAVNSLEKALVKTLEKLNIPIVLEEGDDDFIVITFENLNE